MGNENPAKSTDEMMPRYDLSETGDIDDLIFSKIEFSPSER